MLKFELLFLLCFSHHAFSQMTGLRTMQRSQKSFKEIIENENSVCKFAVPPNMYTLRADPVQDAVTKDYCMGRAICSYDSYSADQIVLCETVEGKCCEDAKECHQRIVKNGDLGYEDPRPSLKEEVKLEEFKSCSLNPVGFRATYIRLGKGESDWHNLCLVGATCINQNDEPNELTYIACTPEGLAQEGSNTFIRCPTPHACVNNRYRDGEDYPKIP